MALPIEFITLKAHVYEVRPRKDKRGFDLISDVLPFGRLWYTTIPDAIDYAEHRSRAHDAVINVYDAAGNVIGDDEHLGDFKAVAPLRRLSRERNFCVEKPN